MKRGVILGLVLAALVVMSSAGIGAALTQQQAERIAKLDNEVRALQKYMKDDEAQLRKFVDAKNWQQVSMYAHILEQEQNRLDALEKQIADIESHP